MWHVSRRVPKVGWSHRYMWPQTIGSHRLDGHGEWFHRYTWHVIHQVPLVGWRRVPLVHVGWRKDWMETFMTNCKHRRWVTTSPIGTRQMENGSTGTHHMEKGQSRRLYDELQASQMNKCRSHRHTSDGKGTMWRFMMKCRSLQIKNFIIDV
jgi:hypothetical protein